MLSGVINEDPSLGNGKINIICIDLNPNLLRAILSRDNVFIPVILIRSYYQSVLYMLRRYSHCFGRVLAMYPESYDQFFDMLQTDFDLSFSEIEKYESAQFKVERFMNRHINDLNEIDYRYLHYLNFWLGIFGKYNINYILSDRLFHGDLNDGVVYDIGRKNGIPIYIFDLQFGNNITQAKSLIRLDKNGIKHLEGKDQIDFDMSKYLFYQKDVANKNVEYIDEQKIINNYHTYTSILNKMTKIAKFRFLTDDYMSWDHMNHQQIAISYEYVKSLCEIYDAISEDIDKNDKFVFYALHFEPEASILNRVELSNQLYIIKTIAQHLPHGWLLYVKEHPEQLRYYNKSQFSYFNNSCYYRSFQFYAQIKRIPNVKIIKRDIQSEVIIKLAKAITTICGTISLEAVFNNKPLILFSRRAKILAYLRDVFVIDRSSDVKKALKMIENGFTPVYNDFNDIISRYIIVETDNSGDIITANVSNYKKILTLIENDIQSGITARGGGMT